MNKYFFWVADKPEYNNKRFQNFLKGINDLLYIQKQNISVELKRTRKDTSDKARGYIWAEILPKSLYGLRELGNDIPNNKTGLEYVYQYLKAQGGFFEIKKITLKDGSVDTQAIFESFGKENGDLARQTEFIDFAIRFCAEKLGVVVQSPEEWKLERGMK